MGSISFLNDLNLPLLLLLVFFLVFCPLFFSKKPVLVWSVMIKIIRVLIFLFGRKQGSRSVKLLVQPISFFFFKESSRISLVGCTFFQLKVL